MVWIIDIDPNKVSLFKSMQENRRAGERKRLRQILPIASNDELGRFLNL